MASSVTVAPPIALPRARDGGDRPPLTELCPGTPDTVLSPDPPGNRRRAGTRCAARSQDRHRRRRCWRILRRLGDAWRLTDTQRARLTPAVNAALGMGWTPQALASATGANTTGVRNPDAVLAARLSPAELPVPPSPSARPPWCGECDQVTRMLDYHGDASRPCPKCKAQRPRKANVAERPAYDLFATAQHRGRG